MAPLGHPHPRPSTGMANRPRLEEPAPCCRPQACPASLTRCEGSMPILDIARSYF
jgi:hypothetical protein